MAGREVGRPELNRGFIQARDVPVSHDKPRLNDQRKVKPRAAGQPAMGIRPSGGQQHSPKEPAIGKNRMEMRDVPVELMTEADFANLPWSHTMSWRQPHGGAGGGGDSVGYQITPQGFNLFHMRPDGSMSSVNPHKLAVMAAHAYAREAGIRPSQVRQLDRGPMDRQNGAPSMSGRAKNILGGMGQSPASPASPSSASPSRPSPAAAPRGTGKPAAAQPADHSNDDMLGKAKALQAAYPTVYDNARLMNSSPEDIESAWQRLHTRRGASPQSSTAPKPTPAAAPNLSAGQPAGSVPLHGVPLDKIHEILAAANSAGIDKGFWTSDRIRTASELNKRQAAHRILNSKHVGGRPIGESVLGEARGRVTHTLKTIKDTGMHASYDRDYDEYRVNHPHNREETAYYTNDPDDAIGTAHHMKTHSMSEGYPDPSFDKHLEPAHSSRIGRDLRASHQPTSPTSPDLNREFAQFRDIHVDSVHEQAEREMAGFLDEMSARMGYGAVLEQDEIEQQIVEPPREGRVFRERHRWIG